MPSGPPPISARIETALRKFVRLFFALVIGLAIVVLQSGLVIAFPLPWTAWAWTTTAIVGDEARQLHQDFVESLQLKDAMAKPDGWDTISWYMSRGFGFTNLEFTYGDSIGNSRTGTVTEYGLPLHCYIDVDIDFIALPPSVQQNQAAGLVMSYESAMTLPYWINAAIFTLVAYFLLGFLFGLPRRIRRAYRARQGRCLACGYPRGTSTVCSECGGELS